MIIFFQRNLFPVKYFKRSKRLNVEDKTANQARRSKLGSLSIDFHSTVKSSINEREKAFPQSRVAPHGFFVVRGNGEPVAESKKGRKSIAIVGATVGIIMQLSY